MKQIARVFSIVLLLFFITTSEAQILKKLSKKIQDNVAAKVVRKDSVTVEHKEGILNDDVMAMVHGKNKIDVSLIPNSYPFSWEYSLEIQSDNNKAMVVDYLLEPNAEYFGFKMQDAGGMFMVIDSKNRFMISTFKGEKGNMAMASKMPEYSEMIEKGNDSDEFSYKALPDKTIMGYNCRGIEATSEKFIMVFYYTNEAKVSFSDLFRAQQKQTAPNALKNYFKVGDKPLMMTMSMKDLKNKGVVTTMKCVSLVEKTNTFNKVDYIFM
ncbi:hypothetical protein [Flavobacterium frigoris]|uniref:DUF4412 domain-containing protein n=1 Tax=Flavobacterium frigoris TaxID=229204 RepID=A0A1H9GGS8_FLAFI|nr:hypothetical protein [Flavobacterium frigoris]SEQ49305.1 hypothetical protein SAMN05444355_102496 [Flavobacterium frigoris]